jgi:hypothetical protein
MIGLFVGVFPALALAQTNLDQGKTAAQMFASDCAACHKTTRGLATGRSGAMLTGFLREHYMTSQQQAAAMAAYVLAGGGAESVPPAQGKGQKPAIEHAAAPSEERKRYRQARRPARMEEEAPASAKLQRSTDETKPEDKESRAEEPRHGASARSSAALRHETEPTRGRRGETDLPAQQPAVMAAPTTAEAPPTTSKTSSQETAPIQGPTAAAPSKAQPGENSPVPRDHIPD